MAGMTILHFKEIEDGQIEFKFRRVGDGAPEWRAIINSIKGAIVGARLLGVAAPVKRRGPRMLGRGGRLRVSRAFFLAIVRLWAEHPAVARALANGALVVFAAELPAVEWLELGRRLAAHMQKKRAARAAATTSAGG